MLGRVCCGNDGILGGWCMPESTGARMPWLNGKGAVEISVGAAGIPCGRSLSSTRVAMATPEAPLPVETTEDLRAPAPLTKLLSPDPMMGARGCDDDQPTGLGWGSPEPPGVIGLRRIPVEYGVTRVVGIGKLPRGISAEPPDRREPTPAPPGIDRPWEEMLPSPIEADSLE